MSIKTTHQTLQEHPLNFFEYKAQLYDSKTSGKMPDVPL